MVRQMNRSSLLALALVLMPYAAQADDLSVRDHILRELNSDGYSDVRISRTFLGRLRFLALKHGARREIVVTLNGEVLRDYVTFLLGEDGHDRSGSSGNDGGESADEGDEGDESDESGGSGPDDDGDEGDEGSDNSGPGSSSSGSG